jgi:hypothetical protein
MSAASSWAVRTAAAKLAYRLPQALTQLADALRLSLTVFDVHNARLRAWRKCRRGSLVHGRARIRRCGPPPVLSADLHLAPNVPLSAMSVSDSAIDSMIRGTERRKLFSSAAVKIK